MANSGSKAEVEAGEGNGAKAETFAGRAFGEGICCDTAPAGRDRKSVG